MTMPETCRRCDRALHAETCKALGHMSRGDCAMHAGRGLCHKCYRAIRNTEGIEAYARLDGSTSHLVEDFEHIIDGTRTATILRWDAPSRRRAAERLGVPLRTLDKALHRTYSRAA